MSLKRASWTDPEGRKKVVLIPEESDQPEMGIPVGPPPLTDLDLPLELEVRLNNELVNRGIITPVEALRNRAEISLAIQSALKLSVDRIIQMYTGPDFKNAKPAREPVVSTNGSIPRPQQQQRRRR